MGTPFGLVDLDYADASAVLRAAGAMPAALAGAADPNAPGFDAGGLLAMPGFASECFEAIHYDPDGQWLYMKFQKGKITYTWGQFPRGKWAAFKAASSKGKFFWAHIHRNPAYQTNYRGGGR